MTTEDILSSIDKYLNESFINHGTEKSKNRIDAARIIQNLLTENANDYELVDDILLGFQNDLYDYESGRLNECYGISRGAIQDYIFVIDAVFRYYTSLIYYDV